MEKVNFENYMLCFTLLYRSRCWTDKCGYRYHMEGYRILVSGKYCLQNYQILSGELL